MLDTAHPGWSVIEAWRLHVMAYCYLHGCRAETNTCIHYAFSSPIIIELTDAALYPCCITGEKDKAKLRKIAFQGHYTHPNATSAGGGGNNMSQSMPFYISKSALDTFIRPIQFIGQARNTIKQMNDMQIFQQQNKKNNKLNQTHMHQQILDQLRQHITHVVSFLAHSSSKGSRATR